MNHVYKVIFNKATATFVAVGEFAKAQGKTKSLKTATSKVAGIAAVLFMSLMAQQALAAVNTTSIGNGSLVTSSGSAVYGSHHVTGGSGAQITVIGSSNAVDADVTRAGEAHTGSAVISSTDVSTATENSRNAVVIGVLNTVNKSASSVAIGRGIELDSADRAVAIGLRTDVTQKDGVALGSYSVADRVAITATQTIDTQITSVSDGVYAVQSASSGDKESIVSTAKNTLAAVSVGGTVSGVERNRQITNVAAGSKDDDAVNVAQLRAVANSLTGSLDKKNYFHANPNTNPATQGGADNHDVVDGIGSATGGWSVAAGYQAASSGKTAIAMGKGAKADSLANIAIGENAHALTEDKNTGSMDKNANNGINKAIAIGSNAQATNAKTIALGDAAKASGLNANAIGSQAAVNGQESTGIGTAVSVTGNYATGIGQRANAAGHQSVAIGTQSITTADRATAIGRSAAAAGQRATALSADSSALGSHSLAMGAYARTTAENATAVGRGADSIATNAVAIGRSATALGTSSIAIGENAIAGGNAVAKEAYNTAYKTAYEAKEKAIYDEVFAATTGTNAQKTAAANAAKITRQAEIIAAGHQAGQAAITSMGIESIAIGKGATATGAQSIAIGVGNLVSGNNAGAFGDPSIVAGAGSYTMGNDNAVGATSANAGAFGNNNQIGATATYDTNGKLVATSGLANPTDASGSRAVGNNNAITSKDTYVLGSGINTATDGKTLLGNTVANSVYLGNDSTVTAIAGKNATLNSTALGDTTTGGATGTVNSATVGGVTYGGFAGNTAVGAVSVGASGAERRIQNVAAGEISATSTDAINGSQLYLVSNGLRDQMPVVYTDADGNKIIKHPDGNFYKATDIPADGSAPTADKIVKPADVIASMNNGNNSTTSPMTLANIKGNLKPVDLQDSEQPTSNHPVLLDSVKNNAATVGDVLNAGWNLQGNGTAVDTVTHNDTVNFVDGNVTTVNVTTDGAGTSTVKVDVNVDNDTITTKTDPSDPNKTVITANTTNLTNTDGKVNLPGTADENKLVNAKDIANAINNSGFKLTSSNDGTSTGVTELVNPSDTVTINGGKNITVSQTGSTVTVATKDEVTFNSVTVGNTSPVVINEAGINAGNKPISNVADGKALQDAVNVRQLNAVKETVVSTDKSITVTSNKTNADGGKEFDLSVNVDGDTIINDNGVLKATTKAPETTNLTVNNDGSVAKPSETAPADGNKFVTADEIADTINQAGFTVTKAGTENADSLVNAGDNLNFKDGTQTTVDVKGNTIQVNVNTATLATPTSDITNVDAGKLTAPTTDGVVAASNLVDAINNTGFKLKTSATDGKKETGTADDGELINPSDTVEMIAGKNLTVQQDTNGKVTFATKDDVTFTNVTSDTIEVPTDVTDKPITISRDGIDMANKPVTNINNGLTTYQDVTKPTNGLVDLSTPTDGSAPKVANSTAATVGDLRNMGWVVSADKTTDNLGTAYSDQVKNANEVKFVGTGLATVSGKTGTDGVRTITVDVSAQNVVNNAQTPVVYTKADGTKVTKANDGNFYPADKVNADGSLKAGTTSADVIKPADVIASMNSGSNSTTAPTTLANVAGNLDGAKTGTTAPTTVSTGTLPTDTALNNAATVGDVLNSGWNLKHSTADGKTITDKDFVRHADNVVFKDGNATTVKVDTDNTTNTIVVDVNTDDTTIKVNDEGKLTAATTNLTTTDGAVKAGDTTSLVTGDQVANAINNSGWKLDISQSEGQAIGTGEELINPSDKLTIDAGKNISITQSGGKVSIATTDDVNFSSVTTNSLEVPTNNGSSVKIDNNGIDAGNTIITNVKAGVNDTDAVNVGQLNNAVAGSKESVTSDNKTVTVKETTDLTTGAKTFDLAVNVGDTLTVDSTTGAINVNTTNLTNTDGKVNLPDTADENKLVNAKDIANAINNSGFNLTSSNNGTNTGVTELINPSDTVTIDGGKNITISQTGSTVTVATKDEVTFNSVTIGNTSPVVINEAGINAGNKTITNVASGGDVETNGANIGDIKRLINSNGGFTINADNQGAGIAATGDKVGTNETVKFTDSGAGNIVTTVKDNEITFGLNKDIAVGDNTTGGSVNVGGDQGITITSTPVAGGNPTNTIGNLTGNLKPVDLQDSEQPTSNHPVLLDSVKNNAATVGDVLNAGWNLQGNGTAVDTVTHNDTVNFVDGNVTTVNVTTDGAGTSTVKVDVNVDNDTIKIENGVLKANTTVINNITNIVGGTDIGGNVVDGDGKIPTDIDGVSVTDSAKEYLRTYDAANKGTVETNSVLTAIKNINEQGTKYLSFNGGEASVGGVRGENDEQSQANGAMSTAIGYKTTANGNNSVAMGHNAESDNTSSIAIGNYAHARGDNSVAMGNHSNAAVQNSVAIGNTTQALGNQSVAIGNKSEAVGTQSIAIGDKAQATGTQSIAVGTGNIVNANHSGAFGDPNVIGSGTTTTEVQASTSSALTGSYAIGNNNFINSNSTFVLGSDVNNGGLDGSGNLTAAGTTVENSVYLGNKSTAVADAGQNLTADGKTQGNTTTGGATGTVNSATVGGMTYGGFAGAESKGAVTVGASGAERRIQNVAAGEISATSTDAINGSQLYAVADRVGNLGNYIGDVADDANAGISSAMAMAALPQAYLPGKSMLTGGMATYNGEGAVAVGFSKLSDNGRWVLKMSGSADTQGNVGGAVGAGFHF